MCGLFAGHTLSINTIFLARTNFTANDNKAVRCQFPDVSSLYVLVGGTVQTSSHVACPKSWIIDGFVAPPCKLGSCQTCKTRDVNCRSAQLGHCIQVDLEPDTI